jgi:hypothetical protein
MNKCLERLSEHDVCEKVLDKISHACTCNRAVKADLGQHIMTSFVEARQTDSHLRRQRCGPLDNSKLSPSDPFGFMDVSSPNAL